MVSRLGVVGRMVVVMVAVAVMMADYIAVKIMTMIVMVVVNRHAFSHVAPKQLNKSRIVGNLLGISAAAHMLIEAQHLVRRCHNQMQIVGNHDDAAVEGVT